MSFPHDFEPVNQPKKTDFKAFIRAVLSNFQLLLGAILSGIVTYAGLVLVILALLYLIHFVASVGYEIAPYIGQPGLRVICWIIKNFIKF